MALNGLTGDEPQVVTDWSEVMNHLTAATWVPLNEEQSERVQTNVPFSEVVGEWDEAWDLEAFVSLRVGQVELLGPYLGAHIFLLWEQLLDLTECVSKGETYDEVLPNATRVHLRAVPYNERRRRLVRLEVAGVDIERRAVAGACDLCAVMMTECLQFFREAFDRGLKAASSMRRIETTVNEIRSRCEELKP